MTKDGLMGDLVILPLVEDHFQAELVSRNTKSVVKIVLHRPHHEDSNRGHVVRGV